MPIYEYRCERCNHTFETIQKWNDEPVKACPRCQGPVQKVLSPPGLLFKGTGWYVTDYPSRDRKKAVEAEKGATSDGKEAAKRDSEAKAD